MTQIDPGADFVTACARWLIRRLRLRSSAIHTRSIRLAPIRGTMLLIALGAGTGTAAETADRAAVARASQDDGASQSELSPTIPDDTDVLASDGRAYPVSRFVIVYLHRGHPDQPRRDRLMELEVALGVTESGLVATREGLPTVTMTLADAESRGVTTYYASAIQTVLTRVHAFLASRGLVGVFVAPDPEHIDFDGTDLRPEGRTAMRLLITTALVTELHTMGGGSRFAVGDDDEEASEGDAATVQDDPVHHRILERSPLGPKGMGGRERGDLLRNEPLEDYVRWMSRHPGRRVDAAVRPSEVPGGVRLDYLVTERRPLILYGEVSNTGSESTDEWRQRVGLIHNQLTNNDDVLSIDFTTAALDEYNAFSASYEVPFPFFDRGRLRVFASYSEYTASDLGAFADFYTGESWGAGAELIVNVHQDGDLFLDVIAGVRYEDIQVENRFVDLEGQEDFTIARVGLRLERLRPNETLYASVMAEWNDGQDPAPDVDELARLGRIFPDTDFGVVKANASWSGFIDKWWRDDLSIRPPAHELYVSLRGQYAFDNRLIPQFQQVAGGFYTVRGYEESAVAGDTVMLGTVEYRYHLQRAFARPRELRQVGDTPVRFIPADSGGSRDWDLVARGFVDAARTITSDRLFFESDETLVGAGVGLEVSYQNWLRLRADFGVALESVDSRGIDSGSSQLHFSAGIVY